MNQASGTFLISPTRCCSGEWEQGFYKVTNNTADIICLEDWQRLRSYINNFYQSQIQNAIDQANNEKDNQQVTPISYIYIIQSENKLYKIGISTNPRKRLSTLQTGSPVPLKLLIQFEGCDDDEKQLHDLFIHRRQRGEWFRLSDDDLASIKCLSGSKGNRT